MSNDVGKVFNLNPVSANKGVSSFNGRGGFVLPQSGDYTAEQVGADPAGTAENAVIAHGHDSMAHEDIRAEVEKAATAAQTAQETAEKAAQGAAEAMETAAEAVIAVAQDLTDHKDDSTAHADIRETLAAKQGVLTGQPGQVAGFNEAGELEAQDLPGGTGSASNQNILDNWYFPAPINQRGVSSTISAKGYFIDRWKLVSGSVAVTKNGLVLDGTIVQPREGSVGVSVTASVLTTDGVIPAEYDDELKMFSITASGQTLVAAKLELGSVQTLAHQDEDGNWALNDFPPNMVLELAKCQRYFYRQRGGRFRLSGCTSNTLYVSIPIPAMHKKPTITCSAADDNTHWIRNCNSNTGMAKLSEFSVYCEDYNNGHSITLNFGKASHGISDALLLISGYIDFDANL